MILFNVWALDSPILILLFELISVLQTGSSENIPLMSISFSLCSKNSLGLSVYYSLDSNKKHLIYLFVRITNRSNGSAFSINFHKLLFIASFVIFTSWKWLHSFADFYPYPAFSKGFFLQATLLVLFPNNFDLRQRETYFYRIEG